LCLQPEPEPNDTYGLAETAAVGLQILAEKFGEDNERWEELSSLVLPFIQANITHESWRHRDAALMAFGTIVGFSDRNSQQILQLIQAMIPILLALLQQNQSPGLIRSSSLWAIGRLFSGQLSFMISSNLDPTPLLNGLTNALSDPNVKVQEQAVSAIGHFGEALSEDIRGISSQAILSLLIQRLSHFTNPQSNPHLDIKVKLASYNAMSCLLDHNPMQDEQQTLMVLEETLRRLEWALGNSPEDLEPLCGFLSTLVNSLSSETLQAHADAIIRILLRSIPYASSDGFIALGSVITGCPQAIRSHQVTIVASVIRRLDSNPCLDSIRFVGDICHTLLEGVTPYAHTLIPRLMAILRNSDSRSFPSLRHLTQ
jgi:importin subunit beta-1